MFWKTATPAVRTDTKSNNDFSLIDALFPVKTGGLERWKAIINEWAAGCIHFLFGGATNFLTKAIRLLGGVCEYITCLVPRPGWVCYYFWCFIWCSINPFKKKFYAELTSIFLLSYSQSSTNTSFFWYTITPFW